MLHDHTTQSEYFFGHPLSADSLFCDLSTDARQTLALIKHKNEFKKDFRVFNSGEPVYRIYILLKGHARLLLNNAYQKKQISRLVKPSEILGLAEMIAKMPSEMSLETITSCFFESIEQEDFIDFLHDYSEVCFRVVQTLGRDIQKSCQLLSSSLI